VRKVLVGRVTKVLQWQGNSQEKNANVLPEREGKAFQGSTALQQSCRRIKKAPGFVRGLS
jgi:hypothetical protein